ncbi:alanine racemase [Mycoplasmatota bacterium WC44]
MYRDTWVEVDLDRIYHNVKVIKEYTGYDMLYAVVKANGYGHGDIEVAEVALEAGATHLAVAFLDEAIRLREHFDVPILVLGYTSKEYFDIASELNISLTITEAIYYDKPLNVHLKIDTGMNRLGLSTVEEIQNLLEIINKSPNLNLEGVFTHLATAGSNDEYYFKQLSRFKEVMPKNTFIHVNNSAGMLAYKEKYNAGRLGIAMYGLAPYEGELPVELRQAFSLNSTITRVHKITKGEAVGYGASFVASKDSYIGTVPIGYADGFLRYHKGREVSINGKRYKIVGNICMDQLMVLVDETVKQHDIVELINDDITVDELASDLNTINYEIVCSISDRVPRIYKRNNKVVKINNYRY